MEVPTTGYAPSVYAPSFGGSSTFAALEASSSVAIDMPAGVDGSLSISVSNQVQMVFAQVTQGNQGGLDEQTLKALIMLLLAQLILNGGYNEQTQDLLQGLAKSFGSAGNTEMMMAAVQASSIIEISLGGGDGGALTPVDAQLPAEGGLDVIA